MDTGSVPGRGFGRFQALVLADGTLLVPSAEATWYASRDGGETFAPVEDFPAMDALRSVPGRYWGAVASGSGVVGGRDGTTGLAQFYVSDDGLHWRTLKLG